MAGCLHMVDSNGQLRLMLKAWHGILTQSIHLWLYIRCAHFSLTEPKLNIILKVKLSNYPIVKSKVMCWTDGDVVIASQVSLENGTVSGFDVRTASSDSSSEPKPSFTLHAHDKAVCSIAYSSSVPNVCVFQMLYLIYICVYIFPDFVEYNFCSFLPPVPWIKWYSCLFFYFLQAIWSALHMFKSSMSFSPSLQVKLWDLSNQPSCIASKNPKAVSSFQFLASQWMNILVSVFVNACVHDNSLKFNLVNLHLPHINTKWKMLFSS